MALAARGRSESVAKGPRVHARIVSVSTAGRAAFIDHRQG
jgi:hypothetical protein